jgi:hypothetical protein
MSVMCNFTDRITYDSPISDMLHCTERITDEMKQNYYFFDVYFLFIKLSVNLLMIDSQTD